MTLSSPDIDRLEELARAATPGKRVALPREDPDECDGIYISGTMEALVKTDSGVYPPEMPDARFIAACDPATILALVSELRGWRVAAGIERTAGVARCILVEPEPPLAIVGRAEPAPPVPGRVGFYIERIIPAEDVDAVAGRRRHILTSHVAQMAAEISGSLEEKRIFARPYRIRISIEPEES